MSRGASYASSETDVANQRKSKRQERSFHVDHTKEDCSDESW